MDILKWSSILLINSLGIDRIQEAIVEARYSQNSEIVKYLEDRVAAS